MQEPLDVTIDSTGIARLTLNRTGRANSFDAGLTDAALAALERCHADPNLRLVILRAEGRSFCAGIDLAWMKESGAAPYEDNYSDALKLAKLLRLLYTLPIPSLAVVQGAAIGFGTGLVAACDVTVGADTAKFRLPEVRLGIVPSVISPYMIDAIGTRACRCHFLSAESFDAMEAYRLGLLHAVCRPERLADVVVGAAAELTAGKPQAQRAAKQLLKDLRTPQIDEALVDATVRRLADIRSGKEAQDALAAMLSQ